MIERGRGAIVNIASVNGLAYVGNEAYSAGKAAMINLTQSIAVRYGHHGVRCNAVAPGSIATPAWQERVEREPDVFERLVKWYPLRRIGTPDDVANAALLPRLRRGVVDHRHGAARRRRPSRRQRGVHERAARRVRDGQRGVMLDLVVRGGRVDRRRRQPVVSGRRRRPRRPDRRGRAR